VSLFINKEFLVAGIGGAEKTTDLIEVDAERACQVALEIDIKSRSVAQAEPGESERELRYSFPFSYKVLDASGKAVYHEEGQARWDRGTRVVQGEQRVDASGGTARIQHNLAKFEVAAPGRIRVEAKVMPDTEYGAEAETVELKVYDNVTRHARSLIGGAVLLLLGPALMILGLILFIVGLSARGAASGQQ